MSEANGARIADHNGERHLCCAAAPQRARAPARSGLSGSRQATCVKVGAVVFIYQGNGRPSARHSMCQHQTKKSSKRAPALMRSASQFAIRPRPDHDCPVSGSRYFVAMGCERSL